MSNVSDFEAWYDKQKAKKEAQSSALAVEALRTDFPEQPDQAAGMMNLAESYAKETGNVQPDLPMVREYGGLFEKELMARRHKKLLEVSPMLADWLREPDNAVVARDDVEGLGWFEGGLRATGNALSRTGNRVKQLGAQYDVDSMVQNLEDQSRSFMDIARDEDVLLGFDGSWTGAIWRYAKSRLAPVDIKDAVRAQMRVADIANRIANTPYSKAGGEAFEQFKAINLTGDIGQDVTSLAAWIGSNPTGAAAFFSEVFVENAPLMIGAGAASRFTNKPQIGNPPVFEGTLA